MANKVLMSWLGFTDLDAAEQDGKGKVGSGPIAAALQDDQMGITHVRLLAGNLARPWVDGETGADAAKRRDKFINWLKEMPGANVDVRIDADDRRAPTDLDTIYRAAVQHCKNVQSEFETQEAELIFHFSPGTPEMGAVWLLLSKTHFPATLVKSSLHHGVSKMDVPFDVWVWASKVVHKLETKPLTEEEWKQVEEAGIITDRADKNMERALCLASKAAPLPMSVCIEGETGTGKELFARFIHNSSERENNPFVAVNCGAIPVDLITSVLFGHERGAFTGAYAATQGLFEQANTGTIFLDEIGELPFVAQAHLLRILDNRTLRRVGGQGEIEVDVRVIAATNRSLASKVRDGGFREDLYYRLVVASLQLPPLRERTDRTFLIRKLFDQARDAYGEHLTTESKFPASLNDEAVKILTEYSCPGNVREMKSVLQRAFLSWRADAAPTNEICKEHIRDALSVTPQGQVLPSIDEDDFDLCRVLANIARKYVDEAYGDKTTAHTQAARRLGLDASAVETVKKWRKMLHEDGCRVGIKTPPGTST